MEGRAKLSEARNCVLPSYPLPSYPPYGKSGKERCARGYRCRRICRQESARTNGSEGDDTVIPMMPRSHA